MVRKTTNTISSERNHSTALQILNKSQVPVSE